ncbi:hypothetical protein NJB1604_07320 [Mycobacterium marinum]|nr:hypothetical protein NJB1604_07320 [Mycobacterium marinum]
MANTSPLPHPASEASEAWHLRRLNHEAIGANAGAVGGWCLTETYPAEIYLTETRRNWRT